MSTASTGGTPPDRPDDGPDRAGDTAVPRAVSGTALRSRPFQLIDRLSAVSGYVSGALVIVAMLVICYGVLLRYIFGASTVWQTELSIYFLMFAAFVGGAYGLRHGDHVRIDLIVGLLSGRAQLVVRLVAALLGFALIAVVTVVAGQMWWETVESGARSGTAWNPPLMYPFAIIPLGMGLTALQYLVILAGLVKALRAGDVSAVSEGGSGH